MVAILLLLLAAGGIGAGVMVAVKGKSGRNAAAEEAAGGSAGGGRAAARSVFGVTAHPALPGVPPEQRCKLWFGSQEVSNLCHGREYPTFMFKDKRY